MGDLAMGKQHKVQQMGRRVAQLAALGLPRSPHITTVISVAWAVSLVAFVVLWTLAPSLLFLQSMQQPTAAALGAPAVADGAGPGSLPLQHHNRRMQVSAGVLRSGQEPPHTADGAGPGCQQAQALQAQPPALDPRHGLPAHLVKQLGPIDVVYLWVNGSDPLLAQELQEYEAEQHPHNASGAIPAGTPPRRAGRPLPAGSDNPVRQARFDAGRDELRYSLRSLDMYMPWYRHVYIVTNGQVPAWLNHHSARVTIVPHTSIFKDPSHLPTFNSVAIQANVLHIPGLSDTFIMLDDDFFLTAPWTLADLVGPDGGQVLTGSTLASRVKHSNNLYLQMTANNNALFDQHFGPHYRFDPAHAPRLFQRSYFQELQQQLPEAFAQTSASRARAATDLLVPSAYMWFVSQFQPGNHSIAPDARTSFSSLNDQVARRYTAAAVADFHTRVVAHDAKATYFKQQHAHKAVEQVALEYELLAGGPGGPKLAAASQQHLHALIKTWSDPAAKVVCLNDDLTDAAAGSRPWLNSVVRDFLEARYSRASQFELAGNTCRGRLPKTAFGTLPTRTDYQAACAQALSPTPAAGHRQQSPVSSMPPPTAMQEHKTDTASHPPHTTPPAPRVLQPREAVSVATA